jgi:chromosome segregation ATPase
MARAGILYSSVAQAAAQLVAAGKNPTVDTVRDALGDTGSKSTIAPMLKRWKAEHQNQVLTQDTGLPADLLQAVKGLYERLQQEAAEKIEAIHTSMEAEKQAFKTQLNTAHELTSTLAQEKDELNGLLGKEKAERVQIENALQQMHLAHTKAETEITGLHQRLADRQSQIDGMHKQLEQARTQFEHYQESTAQQRTGERQQAEQSRLRLENELTEARQAVAAHKFVIGQRELEMTHVIQDKDRVSAEYGSLQAVHAPLQLEYQRQDQQLRISSTAQTELRSRLETMSTALAKTNNELAVLSAEKPFLQERITALEAKMQSLLDENKVLVIEKARMEGLLAQSLVQG